MNTSQKHFQVRGPSLDHVTIRVDDLAEILRVIGQTQLLPPDGALAALHEVLARMLRQVDEAILDEGDRELVRSFLQRREERRSNRTSGIELTAPLRPRHRETLHWLLTGATEKEIACQLGLSVHTVHQYVKAIYRRFRVTSRAQLMASRLRAEV